MQSSKFYDVFRYLSRVAVIFALVFFSACGLPEEEDTEESEGVEETEDDRYPFLHRDENISNRETYENMEAERVVPAKIATHKDASGKPVTKADADAKMKKMEQKLKPESGAKKLPDLNDPMFYDEFTSLNGDEEVPVSLIFNSAPILDVLSAFADILGFNFVADPDMKNMVVTINLNSNMTRRELWKTFNQMLYISHCTAIADGSILRVMHRTKYASQADLKVGEGNQEIYYRRLNYVTSREALVQLRSFLSVGGIILELNKSNSILVCDDRANMAKLRQVLEYLDVASPKQSWARLVVRCKNILPSKLSYELYELLPVLGFKVAKVNDNNEMPGTVQLVGIDRLSMLVISAATQEAVDQIREWVELLDCGESENQERVFVYKVRHNKALYLTYAIAAVFDTQAQSLVIDTTTGKKRLENVNSQSARRNQQQTNASNRNSRSSVVNDYTHMQTDMESNIFSNSVRIFADGVLNRLIIRTTPRTYAAIKALLDRLDVVPAQVLLQVMIIEVTLDETTEFGVEFSGSGQSDNVVTMFGTNYTGSKLNPFTTTTDPSTGKIDTKIATGDKRQDGGTFVIADPDDPQKKFGYIRALAGNTNVKMVSCPQLLVTSHTEAKINIGKKIPLLKSNYTSTSSSGTTQNSYEYTDTGVILTVTPQVTSSDLISLEINQEMSSAVNNTTSKIDSPVITQRTINTSMTLINGQTMVLGGMIQETKNDVLQSLPFINKFPVLKRLFGNTDASVERTEVLVMITGHIINERSKVEDMLKRYNDAIEAINDFDSKLGDGPNASKHKPALMTDKEFWK